jgi:hypothetical protein
MRKVTMITYFSTTETGCLRLYTKAKIIDIVPKIGRTVLFMSEQIEHSVQPMLNNSEVDLSRIALTIWFSHTYSPPILKSSDLIFVGIPCYRDPEIIPTIISIIENCFAPENLRFGIFIQLSLKSEGDIL